MRDLCRINSAIYIFKRDDFLKWNKFLLDPIGWYEMTIQESINIDTIIDLKLARLLSKAID